MRQLKNGDLDHVLDSWLRWRHRLSVDLQQVGAMIASALIWLGFALALVACGWHLVDVAGYVPPDE